MLEDSLLVRLDVKSLHTNISNNEGIKAVKEVYDKNPNKTVSTKVIKIFISLILTLNNFIFNSVKYIQKKWRVQWTPYALHLKLTCF